MSGESYRKNRLLTYMRIVSFRKNRLRMRVGRADLPQEPPSCVSAETYETHRLLTYARVGSSAILDECGY